MDQLQVMDKIERSQNLLRNLLEARNIEVELFFDLTVVFRVFVEVVSEELGYDEKMFFVIEEIDESEQVLAI